MGWHQMRDVRTRTAVRLESLTYWSVYVKMSA